MPSLQQIVPTKEWTTLPRLKSGPWDNEPDKAQWQFNPTIACMVHRGGGQAWCGYVGVTKGHPLFGMGYDEIEEKYDIQIHGGLTFSAMATKRMASAILLLTKKVTLLKLGGLVSTVLTIWICGQTLLMNT